jgi:hypothetical protein
MSLGSPLRRQRLIPNPRLLKSLHDPTLVVALKFQLLAGLDCLHIRSKRTGQDVVQHFLAPILNLCVEFAGKSSSYPIPPKVNFVFSGDISPFKPPPRRGAFAPSVASCNGDNRAFVNLLHSHILCRTGVGPDRVLRERKYGPNTDASNRLPGRVDDPA